MPIPGLHTHEIGRVPITDAKYAITATMLLVLQFYIDEAELVQTARRFLCLSISAMTSSVKGRCVFSYSQSTSNRSTVSFAVEIMRREGNRALSAIVSISR